MYDLLMKKINTNKCKRLTSKRNVNMGRRTDRKRERKKGGERKERVTMRGESGAKT